MSNPDLIPQPDIAKKEQKDAGFEVMKLPEIVFEEEKGAQLFSFLLKAENPNWGETETPLAKETVEYIKENPLDTEILEVIRELKTEGVDEEALYNAALTYNHPERVENLFEMVKRYKPHVKNPGNVQEKIIEILEKTDNYFSRSPLRAKFMEEVGADKSKRMERAGETKERLQSLIDFFKPDPKTTNIKKIRFVPTDPLYKKNSGRAFSAFTGEQIIISHIDNVDNQDHEFLHSVVNPIVDKMSQKMTANQKIEISALAKKELKNDYGEGYFSLLCEEFIRTYNDVIKKGKSLENSYESFLLKTKDISGEDFLAALRSDKTFKARCEEMHIETVEDFKDKSREYYDRFEKENKNELRGVIFEFYKEYAVRPDKEKVNFEQFALSKFLTKIKV